MNINRRLMLQIPVVLAGPLSVRSAAATQLLPTPSNEAPDLSRCAGTLSAFLDTLLPAVGDSPSASSIGVPERILTEAKGQPPYARLLATGCEWLDAAAKSKTGNRFVELDEAGREVIAAAAEASDRRSGPARFFATTHRHAMELFYSHPKSWPALDYPGPPQPVGFLDYAKPPASRSA